MSFIIVRLRRIDRDYFGHRVGQGSCLHCILALATFWMPIGFVMERWKD